MIVTYMNQKKIAKQNAKIQKRKVNAFLEVTI